MERTHAATFRVPARPDAFNDALEGLTRVNVGIMQREAVPPLYEAGVRYQDEPRDVWRHALDVAGERWGDCEDLAAYRAAELRVSGEDPDARVVTYQSGPNRYHAVVGRGDGAVEDPSRILGMGQPKMRAPHPRASANVMGVDTTPDGAIQFEIITIPGGWGRRAGYRGFLKLPVGMLAPGTSPLAQFTIGPQAATPAAATQAAASSAVKALVDNPLIQQALSKLPPGAAQAAQVLTNPSVVSALKNPTSLLNLQTALARPDIALQNAGKVVSFVKDLF
jgi:hypothetical protein